MIDKLLIKKEEIGEGASSTVYKIHNFITNDGFLCLKVFRNIFLDFSYSQSTQSVTDDDKKKYWSEYDNADQQNDDDKGPQIDFDKAKDLLKEYEILNQLDHPNIIKVYGFFIGDKKHNPAILLEWCKGDLTKTIRYLEDIEIVRAIYEICSAMKYVHEHNIIHRDLKMGNILINANKHVKICDFGLSKIVDLSTLNTFTHQVGTLMFMAPELKQVDENYDEKVDVYSFGIILYFLVTKGENINFNLMSTYEDSPMPKTINSLSQSIIKKCGSKSPKNRPSFAQIIQLIIKNNFLLINGIEDKVPELKRQLGLK